jgi:nicotinamidase-related amidase
MKVVFTQDTRREGDPEWEIWPEQVREESWGWQIVDGKIGEAAAGSSQER